MEVKAADIGVTDYIRGIGQVLQYEYFYDNRISPKGFSYDENFKSILLVPSQVIKGNSFNIGKFKYPNSTLIVEINESSNVARKISEKELSDLSSVDDDKLTSISQYYIRDNRLFEIYMLLRYLCFQKLKGKSKCNRKEVEEELRKTETINNGNWRNAWISVSSLGFIDSNNLPTASGIEIGMLEYEEIFTTLFTQEELTSLLSPFKSAYDNRAFDQLEGQVGTLKIFLSRLATKESFWVFSGDEIDLKISNKENPSILVLASDPATQDINSALYSSVLNRTLKLINSKGNQPSGIIADEFPTIYIHKIDNIIATARSNKVAVILGLQEIPQLRQFYKKEIGETISAIIGNILSGSARDKNTLDWLEKMFGKIKQKSYSQSISNQGTTTSINEKMDNMIPAGKIAALRTGEMVGMIAGSEENNTEEYKSSAFSGKINLDMNAISEEEQNYVPLPTYYSFLDKTGKDRKEEVLMTNFRKISKEVELIIKDHISV